MFIEIDIFLDCFRETPRFQDFCSPRATALGQRSFSNTACSSMCVFASQTHNINHSSRL